MLRVCNQFIKMEEHRSVTSESYCEHFSIRKEKNLWDVWLNSISFSHTDSWIVCES
jgi:hypothetical protein